VRRLFVLTKVNAARTLANAFGFGIDGPVAAEAPAHPWIEEARAAQGGDPDAFATLVRAAQRPVYGLCLRLLGNEAEASEVTQEAFLRAWQNLSRYDLQRPFDLWVLAIARNLCLDLLRRRSRGPSEDLERVKEGLASADRSQEEGLISQQQHQSLESALATLPALDREILALYYVQRRTTKEIAGLLGVAPGTIMARLFRAREKLRQKMAAQEEVV
jgi:RNA polymerase sigma-70 factor, ECF subfamily